MPPAAADDADAHSGRAAGSGGGGGGAAAGVVVDDAFLSEVDAAVARAVPRLLARQRDDGSWNANEDMEPSATASQMVLDAFMGRLSRKDAVEGTRFIATRQLDDGSFPGWPHGTTGNLSVTGLCVAALHAAAQAGADRATLARAQAWLGAHGGVDAVVERLWSSSDQTAVYLAMVGLVDARKLPDPMLAFSLAKPLVGFMELKMNAGVIMGFMAMGWITRYLRAKQQRIHIDLFWLLHKLEARACDEYIRVFQNPDGNFDGNTIQSGLYVAGLYAMGISPKREHMKRAVAWLDAQKIYDDSGMHVRVFTCENWMTAFTLRALLHAGVSRRDPRIERALQFLASSQIKTDMPLVDQRKPHATRSGGWAFQASNPTMPDSDDTGSVLSALGLALNRDTEPLTDAMTDVVQRCVDKALPQLLDMQAPDGGWPAFVWNLGEKAPGPLFKKPNPIPRSLVDQIAFFLSPPVELADPPAEGLTGRVLSGLGAVGHRSTAPAVVAATRWLASQRADNGVWWGRWLVNYLAGTASVVSGLAACGVDMKQEWLAAAVDWLIAKQNADGGWGETPASYADPSQAGRGPSMPPLTAIVLTALIDAGKLEHPSVPRGIRYLLGQQMRDGFWPNHAWLQVMMPPDQFYEYDGERMCRPIEALALFARRTRDRLHPPDLSKRLQPLRPPPGPFPLSDQGGPASTRATGSWATPSLQALRAYADPPADDVITQVFRDGQAKALSDVMVTLVKSDDPLPATLPAVARKYFIETQQMPSWADPRQIAIAQDIFGQHGWATALGLFTSSLPQAYCAAKGARVLLQTQGMSRNARRRILETAQFIFDVLNKDSFGPGALGIPLDGGVVGGEVGGEAGVSGVSGRAIRAAQKVRLMHATIRHLILVNGGWDAHAWGVPVNQEDLVGTLMTFSVVVLDTFDVVDIKLTKEQQAAYLHIWKVVGHFMGVNEALQPRDVDDARALMRAIREHQWHASVEGAQLGAALVQSMDDYLPGDLFVNLPSALVRRIAGNRCADLLSLPGADWTTLAVDAAVDIDRITTTFAGKRKHAPGDWVMRYLATELMEALIKLQRDGKEASFRIPTELIRAWKLDD